MISHFIRSMAFLTCIVLVACTARLTNKPDPPTRKNEEAPPKLLGRIASVPADKRFVLIQSFGPWNIESGTILTTRGTDERSANLRVTGESLGQFAAADLQSGLVQVGDAVYSRHVPKPPEPTTDSAPKPELPQNQQSVKH